MQGYATTGVNTQARIYIQPAGVNTQGYAASWSEYAGICSQLRVCRAADKCAEGNKKFSHLEQQSELNRRAAHPGSRL